ncbi:MAG: EAL domain-containing protein [Gammaproteobacteria bacterium]|nr:EAL domain-containing protein [Gammaproteobacteria bacterium]
MTLFKQVALLVSLVFLILVFVTTIAEYRRTGVFIETQLQSVAQDMATTLGVTISNTINNDDKATLETLFNAVFDSGYYSRIELVATDGTSIHKKQQYLQNEGVPYWFISLIPLEPATGTTQVMKGWLPMGQLSVTLHPGLSYVTMYENLLATLLWFSALFCLGLAVLWYLLHLLLRPLNKVRHQADAIHNNQFVRQDILPKTLELRSVVEAMNTMVAKVKQIFDDQEKTLVRYQELLYVDSLTGLGNKRYVLSQLDHLQTEDASYHGCLAVVKIQGLQKYRDNHGYEEAENIIKLLADIFKQKCDQNGYKQISHLTDDEFSLLVPENSKTTQQRIAIVFDEYKSQMVIQNIEQPLVLNAGIAAVYAGRNTGDVFAEVDFALTQALAAGPYSINEMTTTHLALPQGKMQWRSLLEQAISSNGLYLVGQMAMDNKGLAMHQEVYVRLKNDNDQIIPAGMFMPMAMSLGFGLEIDKVVFKLVREVCLKHSEVPVALNLSSSFFIHADAYEEFNQLMSFLRKHSIGLCVEASHNVVNQYTTICTQIAERVRQSGYSFGIDNLDLSSSLQVLQTVRPDYVKVNAKALYDMTTGDVPAGYQALRTMTNTMGIGLIAVAVDSQELYDQMQGLGVDGLQGNLLSETRAFS